MGKYLERIITHIDLNASTRMNTEFLQPNNVNVHVAKYIIIWICEGRNFFSFLTHLASASSLVICSLSSSRSLGMVQVDSLLSEL